MNPRASVGGPGNLIAQGRLVWDSFINALFPPKCGGCQAEGVLWCERCRASLVFLTDHVCLKCGEPTSVGELCAVCQTQSWRIELIRSVVLFHGPLRKAVHRFKYEHLSGLAKPLGDLLIEYWRTQCLAAEWLVPVPLHPVRQRERGYNQAGLLARQLGHGVGVPVLEAGLRRTRITAVQMELSAVERKTNVAGAFDCRESRVRGCQIAVIDDVCTTGATLEACAVALLQAGAASVIGLTLARTP
jgi:ComF family protein